MSDPHGQVFDVIRGSTHDGPGVRTTVFFKGCPLRCAWCQNPEGLTSTPEVWWEPRKCIGCRRCLAVCRSGALLDAAEGGLRMDRQRCECCGACVEECAPRALTFTSQTRTLGSLLAEALKDKAYYQAFGGGVTVSGGEPLNQYPFVAEFLRRLHEAGVHTALDTCGLASAAALAAVLPYTDHVLFDIKFADSAAHRTHTGQPNEAILANLALTAKFIRQANRQQTPARPCRMKLWIRTPLIPGATATPENITAIGRFVHDHLEDVCERWELCAFNPACGSKHEKLGLAWPYAGRPLMSEAEISPLAAAARATGAVPGRVVTSGLVTKTGTLKQELSAR